MDLPLFPVGIGRTDYFSPTPWPLTFQGYYIASIQKNKQLIGMRHSFFDFISFDHGL